MAGAHLFFSGAAVGVRPGHPARPGGQNRTVRRRPDRLEKQDIATFMRNCIMEWTPRGSLRRTPGVEPSKGWW